MSSVKVDKKNIVNARTSIIKKLTKHLPQKLS